MEKKEEVFELGPLSWRNSQGSWSASEKHGPSQVKSASQQVAPIRSEKKDGDLLETRSTVWVAAIPKLSFFFFFWDPLREGREGNNYVPKWGRWLIKCERGEVRKEGGEREGLSGDISTGKIMVQCDNH